MALKGHTKIQLFDAKTGELVQETNDDNMVTNAISRLINPPLDFLVGDVSLNAVLSKTLPIQTVGMGGVMVFSNKIEEDPNHVFASNSDVSIGHAGSAYSGTNTKRGTYNANESKALSNGYRNVWDFGTDRANGDISCVCLTSKIGGDTGIDGNNDSNYGRQYISSYSIGGWAGSNFLPAGIIEKGKFCGAYINGNTINLNYYQGFDSDKIPLAKSSSVSSTLYKSVSITCENYNVSGTNTNFYTDDEGILKVWGRNYTSLGSGIYQIDISYASVNILNGTKVDDKKITVDFSTFPAGRYAFGTTGYYADTYFYPCSAMKNYIVAYAKLANPADSSYPWELVLLDYNGNFVKYFNFTHWSNVYSNSALNQYDSYNNRLRITTGTAPRWLTEDGEVVRGVQTNWADNSYSEFRGVYCYKNIYPFYIYGYSYSGSTPEKRFNLYIDYTYLATINNLATTVTKTNGQTMKITYDLTES